MTAAAFKRVTDVTYLGYVNRTLAYRGIPLQAAYCASKHATLGFTMSLRIELMHDGSNVRVTMLQMPAFNTPQFTWCKTRMPRKPQPASVQ